MSSAHRSPRPRRWRAAFAVAGVAARFLAATPAHADNVKVDVVASGDTSLVLSGGSAQTVIQYFVQENNAGSGIPGCDITDPSTPSVWTINLPANVSASSSSISFTDCGVDVPITYTATSTMTGAPISLTYASGPALGQSDGHPAGISLTVAEGSGSDNCPGVDNPDQADADGDGLGDACDDNSSAPVVSTDAQDTTGFEGSAQTNSGAFTDADGNSTLSISGSGAGTVTDNGDGTWSWSYTPVDNGSGAVTVTASDGEHTDAVDTFGWTASNANPVVAQPAFTSTSVDCTHSVTLGSISFSDPGTIDNPWHVVIDWGDGSAPTTYDANSQGAQADQTHPYNAVGTWTATVTVTDKDGGVGSNTSSNTITVNQVYTTDFLPPFDDSSPSKLIVNTMKNGRTVPVKASIYDVCAGAYVTSPSVVTIRTNKVTAPTTAPNPDAVENYADAGASSANTNLFRWTSDSTAPGGGFWIYNLDSKALSLITNSYYRIDITVDGNQATKTDWAVLQPVK